VTKDNIYGIKITAYYKCHCIIHVLKVYLKKAYSGPKQYLDI